MTFVETVLGPLPADRLGSVDAHEHVFLRTPVNPGDEFLDPAKAEAELTAVAKSGIQAVVDLTPVGLGRQPRQLAAVSRATGLHIIAATGYHRAAHYHDGHWAKAADEQTLLKVLLDDLQVGMDAHDWDFPWPEPTGHKAGIIKLGASYQQISPVERRWFAAAAEAARLTGAPVAVHTEVGTAAHAILDLLEQEGVPAHRVMLAHTDRNPDPGLHEDLISRGAFLVYDTIGRIKYRPDSVVLDLIDHVAGAGKLDQLCLGTDIGRRSTFTAYGGGPGMDVLGREFIPRLERRIGPDAVMVILQQAPRRILTWSGRTGPDPAQRDRSGGG